MSQPPERRAPDGSRPREPSCDERVGIAGSGTIACGLAACAAERGGQVIMWARSAESADRARAEVAKACDRLERPEAAAGVRIALDIAELAGTTLVVEAVSEEEALKCRVLSSLTKALSEASIVATTTSSLRIESLAQACARPSRFFGLHVFNPVERMPLVELCFPDPVDEDARARALGFCEALGKTPVEVPDETGFVVNRLLFPYLFDAVRLLERTGIGPEEIDACMKLGASHPMGPLELLDLVGLDVADSIGEALYAETGEPAHRPPRRIKELVSRGALGRKSGEGFYNRA